MPKIKLRRMVAVYGHGQSIRTTPLCYIPREDAEWWVASGGAELIRFHYGKIVLNKIKSTELLGASGRMGPSVVHAVAEGSKFHAEILMRWRFGFIEPPEREEKTRVRALQFAAPDPVEA